MKEKKFQHQGKWKYYLKIKNRPIQRKIVGNFESVFLGKHQ